MVSDQLALEENGKQFILETSYLSEPVNPKNKKKSRM